MKPGSYKNTRRLSKGTSLIEVMVSVLVLSIGLLGIAAMQATALRNTQSAMERTQAVVQSYAVLDAMRANLTQARNNQYDVGWTCAAPTGATLINKDMIAWVTSMKNTISSDACGRITCGANGSATDDVCTVDVRWDDTRGTGGSSAQTMTMVSRI
ncbi:MAG: type IV pilus modification protein PilV [Arenimonas sp.]